jgi:predicted molibdopterin-dependent oxidoreductase YjgC
MHRKEDWAVSDEDQTAFQIEVNGQLVPARQGQTIAAVLLSAGRRVWRRTQHGDPRGLFCGMGVCFECLVTVDGVDGQRACMTPAQPGMQVQLATGEESGDGQR